METRDFDYVVEDASNILLCPSAILSSLGRDGEGPIYTHQKEFIPKVIDAMEKGKGIYTTKFVVDNALENPRYGEYIQSSNASELDKQNYELLGNLVSEMRKKDLILDFDSSNDRVKTSGTYDIFYKLAHDNLDDIWEQKQRKKKADEDAIRVFSADGKAAGLMSYMSDHHLMHMKSDFIATSLVLGSGDKLSVLSNDLNDILKTYQDKIRGTPVVNSGNFKFFTRRSASELDRMII